VIALEIPFPFEFIVSGTAVSAQARSEALKEWKSRIKDSASKNLPHGHFATQDSLGVTIFYFLEEEMQGDIDNIIKPILDALCKHVYMDDHQIERIFIARFEPEKIIKFDSPSIILDKAIEMDKPNLYIKISPNLYEGFIL
jgi:crossover junction endodeoxyribonuclease RusA